MLLPFLPHIHSGLLSHSHGDGIETLKKKTFFKIKSENVVDCGVALRESSVKNLRRVEGRHQTKKTFFSKSDLV